MPLTIQILGMNLWFRFCRMGDRSHEKIQLLTHYGLSLQSLLCSSWTYPINKINIPVTTKSTYCKGVCKIRLEWLLPCLITNPIHQELETYNIDTPKCDK